MRTEDAEMMVVLASSIGKQTLKLHQFESFLVNYTGVHSVKNSLEEIADGIEHLKSRKFEKTENTFMQGYLKAMECYVRVLQGDNIPYEQIMMDIQQIPFTHISEDFQKELEEIVTHQLVDRGYKGSLGEQINAFEQDYRIPAEGVVDFARERMQESKKESEMILWPLPEDDGVESIEGIRNVFWSGYSRYLGGHKGKLSFNLERSWSGPSFINVLVHEGYPGHQFMYSYWEYLYANGRYPKQAAWYLLGTPGNSIFEGVAENACHFLGWDDLEVDTPYVSEEEKKRIILARDIADLKRILQTNACFTYHLGEMSKEECLDFLKTKGFMDEHDANNTVKFFCNPIQKLTYPCYYYGKWLVRKAYDQCPAALRGKLFELLYFKPLSNAEFLADYKKLTGITLVV